MKCIAHVGSIVALSLAAATAHGDEIRILSGHLDFTWGQRPSVRSLVLTGERGFSFQSSDSNLVFAGTNCRPDLEFDVPCTPGTQLALSVALAPFGSATLDGIAYPNAGGNDAFLMQLNSSAMLPPLAPTGTAAGEFRVPTSSTPSDMWIPAVSPNGVVLAATPARIVAAIACAAALS